MFPPFDTTLASQYCLKLLQDIDNGSLKLSQITENSSERSDAGVMIGTLVCKKQQDTVILHAVSGIAKQLECLDSEKSYYDVNNIRHIIVEPLVSSLQISQTLIANDLEIHNLTDKINSLKSNKKQDSNELNLLITKRTELTTQSLSNVFSLYTFTTYNHSKITLNQIIREHGKLPPTGTGDCCAPKLLDYAFKNALQPISMAEFFYGKNSKNKFNNTFYPPCDERCKFILPYMLGLEIIYRDDNIIVVNKPSGLLSVPGRGPDKVDSVVTRVKKLFPFCMEQPSVHRLDMETSGLMVLAFDAESHKNLNKQFAEGQVSKAYIALLNGVLEKSDGQNSPKHGEKTGCMQLKFRLDIDNRPHQIYDEINGKIGITEWENLGVVNYQNPATGKYKKVTRIRFVPKTGRTHQLRLAASSEYGFNLPIIGDTLYGSCEKGQRLMLHAQELSFYHPATKQLMNFYCSAPF